MRTALALTLIVACAAVAFALPMPPRARLKQQRLADQAEARKAGEGKPPFEFHAPGPLALKPVKGLATTMEDAVRFKFLKAPLGDADVTKLVDLSLAP